MDSFSLGQYLREAREAKELSLTDAESALKIRRYILESFEQGSFSVADASPVQIRGFIRNYARYLQLDEDQVLTYYDSSQEAASRRTRRERKKTRKDPTQPDRRSNGTTAGVNPRSTGEYQQVLSYGSLSDRRQTVPVASRLLNLLVVMALGLSALGIIAFVTLQLVQTLPESEVIEDASNGETRPVLGDQPPTLTFTPRPTTVPQRTPTLIPRSQQVYSGQPVLVTVEVIQRCWVRFVADGTVIVDDLVRPGEQFTIEYEADNEIVVNASNAAALVITYNGQPQPPYGGRGQKVEITFRPNNNVEISSGPGFDPTSQFSPTPLIPPTSIAGTLLAELTPSNTPGPSPTPSDTPTITITPPASPTPTTTPTATATPTITLTPTDTLTPSSTPTTTLTPTITSTPSATAIVPPRITPTPATPEKP